jgi:ATP-dependent Clp protease ATP-binding subunit ClpA
LKTTGLTKAELYTIDLIRLAQKRKLDPVIGRDEEIRRIIQILCRRKKNNPVLIGEPAVGKTSIVAFNPLKESEIRDIVDIQIDILKSKLNSRGLNIEITNDLKSWISKKGYDRELGARPLNRQHHQNGPKR